jgi:hypothetical protein
MTATAQNILNPAKIGLRRKWRRRGGSIEVDLLSALFLDGGSVANSINRRK